MNQFRSLVATIVILLHTDWNNFHSKCDSLCFDYYQFSSCTSSGQKDDLSRRWHQFTNYPKPKERCVSTEMFFLHDFGIVVTFDS